MRPDLDRATPHRILVDRLEAETVAIVDEDIDVRCAGVWIGPAEILTAAHCVADAGESPAYEILRALDDSFPAWDPKGQIVRYQMQTDGLRSFWTGRVYKFDKSNDLALIQVTAPPPGHDYARVSQADIEDGDRVEVVGHPAGVLRWSYAEGEVSASRLDGLPQPDGTLVVTLQLEVPISPGNSGGPAFDADGNLIGIAWGSSPQVHGMGFFVHRDAIKRFLKA